MQLVTTCRTNAPAKRLMVSEKLVRKTFSVLQDHNTEGTHAIL